MLTKERSVKDCCLGEVNIRCTVQLSLEDSHFQSAIKQEREGGENL